MLTSEILSGADLHDVKIGIGCAPGSEYIESSVRAVDSPNVVIYRDSQKLADDLASGAIDVAVRGDLPSSDLLPKVRGALGLERLERAVLLDIDGRAVFMVPVGIDEGYSVEEKVDMADRVADLWKALGGDEPRIAVMSGGRTEDKGRSEFVDMTMDNAASVVRELKAKGRDAYDAQILIEDAIDEADIIVAPDGIAGNLIFRAVHFIGGIPTLGAPVMNSMDRLFVDTSRRKNDYTDAIYLAAKLARMRK